MPNTVADHERTALFADHELNIAYISLSKIRHDTWAHKTRMLEIGLKKPNDTVLSMLKSIFNPTDEAGKALAKKFEYNYDYIDGGKSRIEAKFRVSKEIVDDTDLLRHFLQQLHGKNIISQTARDKALLVLGVPHIAVRHDITFEGHGAGI